MPRALRWSLIGLLILAVGIGVGQFLPRLLFHTGSESSSSSPTKNPPSASSTINVTIPPHATDGDQERTINVAIPDPIIDKLGASSDTGTAKIFESIWPGVSALLGALVGGAVTLAAGSLKNSHEQRALNETRKQSIKDRSFNACIDALKSGRLATAAATKLWYEIYRREPGDRIAVCRAALDDVVRDLYTVVEVMRLTVPPSAKLAFDDYWKTLTDYINKVKGWEIEYLSSAPSETQLASKDTEFDEARYAEFDQLEDDVLARRDSFVEVAKTQFDDGSWSIT